MKALDSFTVERLEELIKSASLEPCDAEPIYDNVQVREIAALARIALAAKRAEPVDEIAFDMARGIMALVNETNIGGACQLQAKIQCFIEEALTTTPQLNSQQGWIKCSDQMPENDERKPIAIYTGNCLGQGMFVASYDDDEFFDYWEGTEIKGVTHWMPLPAAPEKSL